MMTTHQQRSGDEAVGHDQQQSDHGDQGTAGGFVDRLAGARVDATPDAHAEPTGERLPGQRQAEDKESCSDTIIRASGLVKAFAADGPNCSPSAAPPKKPRNEQANHKTLAVSVHREQHDEDQQDEIHQATRTLNQRTVQTREGRLRLVFT